MKALMTYYLAMLSTDDNDIDDCHDCIIALPSTADKGIDDIVFHNANNDDGCTDAYCRLDTTEYTLYQYSKLKYTLLQIRPKKGCLSFPCA